MTEIIENKLQAALSPDLLEIKNISHLHEGHAGHDGSGESHFKLTVVAPIFDNLSRIERHKCIYDVLQAEMKGQIHALSIKAFTPEEYKT